VQIYPEHGFGRKNENECNGRYAYHGDLLPVVSLLLLECQFAF